jgi:hypothetical protein
MKEKGLVREFSHLNEERGRMWVGSAGRMSRKAILVLGGVTALLILGFQNCSQANFAGGRNLNSGGTDTLAGTPDQNDPGSANSQTPPAPAGTPPPSLLCGNQIEVDGKCVDFECQQVVALQSVSELSNIPARSSDGICYAFQLMSAIPEGPSSLTTTIDTTIVTRDHDIDASNPSVTHNPYEMGKFLGQFQLQGPRVVKLTGSKNAVSPILVDNFVLIGIFPSQAAPLSDYTKFYSVYGTSDSSIANSSGMDTHSIVLNQQYIPVTPFASGGTASIGSVNISNDSPANIPLTLDLRAEDCGGARQLSDIWLVFQ